MMDLKDWVVLEIGPEDDFTCALIVPNGMLIRYETQGSVALCFVPCTPDEKLKWIKDRK